MVIEVVEPHWISLPHFEIDWPCASSVGSLKLTESRGLLALLRLPGRRGYAKPKNDKRTQTLVPTPTFNHRHCFRFLPAHSTMTAKQVYGKRGATNATTAYAKFISPDKDPNGDERKGKHAAKLTKSTKPTKPEKQDVVVIEDHSDQARIPEDAVGAPRIPEKKKRRARKDADPTCNVVEIVDELDDLTRKLDVVTIGEEQNKQKSETIKKRGPQKTADTKSKPSKSHTVLNKQTTGPLEHSEQQSKQPPPPPVRKLKAVKIPKRTPPSSMSPAPAPTLPPQSTDPYTAYVSPLLSLSYERRIVAFEDWALALKPHFDVTKIAEASFSEVYRLKATSSAASSANESVLKLMALRMAPNAPLLAEPQTRNSKSRDGRVQDMKAREEEEQWKSQVTDVLSEVKLLRNLNHIPGFTNFRELTVLQGRPSTSFVQAWKAWNKSRPKDKKSEFPDPSKKTSYDDRQLWAVIEMEDAGTDCEKVMEAGGLSTVWEVWDVFWGVCLSVAKAEEACNFEHRDLHLENICIQTSRSQVDDDLTLPFVKDPLRRKLGFTGLETTVIDYTLSRADILSPSSRRVSLSSIFSSEPSSFLECSPSTPPTREVAYLDLNKDAGLFTGDAEEEYQYEIYRYMRGAALYGDPLNCAPTESSQPSTPRRSPGKPAQHLKFDDVASTPRRSPRKSITNRRCDDRSDIWKQFHPKTNLVWAHFILYKLLEHLKGGEPKNLSSKQIMRNVEARIEDAEKVARKAKRMYARLEMVAGLLEPGVLAEKESLGSMKELVVLALEERWLRIEDVAG